MPEKFYQTAAWRKLKRRVMSRWKAEGRPCGYCGKELPWGQRFGVIVDHILNRKQHPHLAFVESNLMVVHHACNSKKAAWSEKDDRPEIGADGFPIGSEWS